MRIQQWIVRNSSKQHAVIIALFVVMIFVLGGCVSVEKTAKKAQLAQLYTEMGIGYLRNEQYKTAKERLLKAIENKPDYPPAHHYLAQVYYQLGNVEQAQHYYDRSLELDATDPFLQNNYAVFLCNIGRVEESEVWFLKLAKNVDYGAPHLLYENLGNCVYRGQSREQQVRAEGYFKRALTFDPKLIVSLTRMAEINFNRGDYFKARAFLERFVALESYTPEMLLLGVKIEKQLGDEKMMAHYKQLLMERFGRTIQASQASQLE